MNPKYHNRTKMTSRHPPSPVDVFWWPGGFASPRPRGRLAFTIKVYACEVQSAQGLHDGSCDPTVGLTRVGTNNVELLVLDNATPGGGGAIEPSSPDFSARL